MGVIPAALTQGEPLGLREVVATVLTLGGVTLARQNDGGLLVELRLPSA